MYHRQIMHERNVSSLVVNNCYLSELSRARMAEYPCFISGHFGEDGPYQSH